MPKEIRTSILIHATSEKVWGILTNFERYQNWNPFIKLVKGQLRVGNYIKVVLKPPDSKSMTFNPKVLAFETNKEIRWIGKFLSPSLFEGEHLFQIIDNRNTTVTFIQSEKFSGILVPFLGKLLNVNTKTGFNLMNTQLKILSEQK